MSIYKAIHDNIVNSNKDLKEEWKPVGSGLQRHRILPRHQGGTYEESNCTYLTRRQHIIAHWLLWKIHRHEGDLFAWKFMIGVKVCPMLGKTHSKETRQRIGIASIKTNKGRKHSKESRHNMSIGAKKRERKPMSEETKLKIALTLKGKKHNEIRTWKRYR